MVIIARITNSLGRPRIVVVGVVEVPVVVVVEVVVVVVVEIEDEV